MRFSLNGFIYQVFIDPLISGLRKSVAEQVRPGETVIDIACGTGALSAAIARHAGHVTGIDLSDDMIVTARRMARRKGINNISFELHDATDLSCYTDNQFDVAVTSMAMHQFEPGVAVKVLREMRRIAGRVIIADYNCPMTPGFSKWLAWAIERAARGDHYRNFRQYMAGGGAGSLFDRAGLDITGKEVKGGGVFVIAWGREHGAGRREKGAGNRQ
jgi:ubiquinone/menaquinone biosynthesis C-methylase UbiE